MCNNHLISIQTEENYRSSHLADHSWIKFFVYKCSFDDLNSNLKLKHSFEQINKPESMKITDLQISHLEDTPSKKLIYSQNKINIIERDKRDKSKGHMKHIPTPSNELMKNCELIYPKQQNDSRVPQINTNGKRLKIEAC